MVHDMHTRRRRSITDRIVMATVHHALPCSNVTQLKLTGFNVDSDVSEIHDAVCSVARDYFVFRSR